MVNGSMLLSKNMRSFSSDESAVGFLLSETVNVGMTRRGAAAFHQAHFCDWSFREKGLGVWRGCLLVDLCPESTHWEPCKNDPVEDPEPHRASRSPRCHSHHSSRLTQTRLLLLK